MSGKNQEIVVQKAAMLFWKNGYAGTTMRDIQKAIDMRPGSIYATFGGKDALFLKSIDYYREMVQDNLERVFGEHDSAYAGLQACLKYTILPAEDCPSHLCFLVKIVTELDSQLPELVEAAQAGLTETRLELSRQIQQVLVETGKEASNGSEELSAVLQAQIIGLKMMLKLGRCAKQIERDIEQVMISLFKQP